MESLAYTVKEVNSTIGLETFNIAVICETLDLPLVKEVLSRAFDNISILFMGDQTCPKKGTYVDMSFFLHVHYQEHSCR